MSYKERLAKRTALFSLKTYLLKKAQKRADLLQYRAAKKNGTLDSHAGHTHEEDHLHVHEDELSEAPADQNT